MDYLLSRFNSFSLDTKHLTVDNLWERSKSQFFYTLNSKTLIVALPGWGQNFWSWGRVKNFVTKSGASFLVYQFPREILSNDAELTRETFEVISKKVREDLKSLKDKKGFEKIVLLAPSLSSSFGSMIYKGNTDINEVVLIVPGENLARDLWTGCRTQHLKRSYERQGMTVEELESEWHNLASENNLPAPETKIKIFYGRTDKVIPYKYSKHLTLTLRRRDFHPEVRNFWLGHYFLLYYFLLSPKSFLSL